MNVLIPVKFLDHGSEFKKMRLLSHHCHKSQKKRKSSNTADKKAAVQSMVFFKREACHNGYMYIYHMWVPLVLRWKLNTRPTPTTKEHRPPF